MEKKELLENAKSLRRNMTRQERRLWYDFLKDYPIKIYKQRIIDNFIADFYCHKAKLIIEIDGSQHYTPEGKEYDRFRTEIMNQHGLFVLRFTNGDIDNCFDGVCHFIDKTIKERMNLSPANAGALLQGEP